MRFSSYLFLSFTATFELQECELTTPSSSLFVVPDGVRRRTHPARHTRRLRISHTLPSASSEWAPTRTARSLLSCEMYARPGTGKSTRDYAGSVRAHFSAARSNRSPRAFDTRADIWLGVYATASCSPPCHANSEPPAPPQPTQPSS